MYFDSVIHEDPVYEESYYVNPQKNYCVRRVMYECDCGPALLQQKGCKFFDKSTQREECMYRHSGSFCQNLKANEEASSQ